MLWLANPDMLWLLLLLPPLVYASRRWQRPAVMAYSSLQELATLPPSRMARWRQALPGLRVVVMLLCILTLARPQWGFEATRVLKQGIAIDMVVDVSRSMEALERQPDGRRLNRLEMVKEAFRAFVQGGEGSAGRDGDLIGMVTFARYADSVCPLTLDHDMLLALLERVEIVSLPDENGTAIGEAIALGVERLRSSTAASRVLILLTDGSNNAGDTEPLLAAQIASALGIKIYTIGATTGGVDGQTGFPSPSVSIDEQVLLEIARRTDGRYYRTTERTALQAIYAEIDRLEKTTTVAEHYQQYVERGALFLLPGLGLIVLEVMLVNTRWRTVP